MRFYNNMIESIEKLQSYFYNNPIDVTFKSYTVDKEFISGDGFLSGFTRFYDARLKDDTPEWVKDITICRVVYDEDEDLEDVWYLELQAYDMPESLWDCGVYADCYSIHGVLDAISNFCGEHNELTKETLLLFMKDIFNINVHIIDKDELNEEK